MWWGGVVHVRVCVVNMLYRRVVVCMVCCVCVRGCVVCGVLWVVCCVRIPMCVYDVCTCMHVACMCICTCVFV